MSRMRSFLLAPIARQISICGLIATLFVLSAYVLSILDDWRTTQANRQQWVDVLEATCTNLFSRLDTEIKTIDDGKCHIKSARSLDEEIRDAYCESINAKRRAALISRATNSGCPIDRSKFMNNPHELPRLKPPTEPQQLAIYVFERSKSKFPAIFVAIFALSIILIILFDMGRRLVLETHLGWRRIIFAGSFLCSLVAFMWELLLGERFYFEDRVGPAFIYGMVAFVISIMLATYGRVIFKWVADGFDQSSNSSQKSGEKESAHNVSHQETNFVKPPGYEPVRRLSITDDVEHSIAIAPSNASEIQETIESSVSGDASEVAIDQSKTFFGGIYHPWRRLFARTVDLTVIATPIFLSAGYLFGLSFPEKAAEFAKALENPTSAAIILYLFWLPLEAGFLATTGTTPAKWVFGILVVTSKGKKLTYSSAFKRTLMVWIQGEGIGIPLVTPFTRYFAYRRLTKTGTTLWDASVGSVVTHKKWGVIRATASTLLVIVALMFMAALKTS